MADSKKPGIRRLWRSCESRNNRTTSCPRDIHAHLITSREPNRRVTWLTSQAFLTSWQSRCRTISVASSTLISVKVSWPSHYAGCAVPSLVASCNESLDQPGVFLVIGDPTNAFEWVSHVHRLSFMQSSKCFPPSSHATTPAHESPHTCILCVLALLRL
jgi:hypothetical protein